MNSEAWAAELGRLGAPEQLDFPQSAGTQRSHFEALGKEARGKGGVHRVSWEPPAVPEEQGTVKTERSCWSGSLTLDLTLPDNDSPELTSPEAIHHRPRHKPSLTASACLGASTLAKP